MKNESAKEIADKLAAQGYRRVSNKYGMLSRIDDPNWKPNPRTARGDPDWYRRCVSKDTIEVPLHIAKLVPTSGHDPIGYVDKDTIEVPLHISKLVPTLGR